MNPLDPTELLHLVVVPLILRGGMELAVAASLLLLATRYRRPYMKAWGIGWLMASVGAAGSVVSFSLMLGGGSGWAIRSAASAIHVIGLLGQGHLQIAGARLLAGRPPAGRNVRVALWGLIALYAVVSVSSTLSADSSLRLLLRVGLPYAFLGTSFVISALAVARGPRREGTGFRALPVAFVIYGVQRLVSALQSGQIMSLPMGSYVGFVDGFVTTVVALGVVAWFLEEERQIVLDLQARQRRLEADLLQGRKLEALGNFAGGVAHEFNNLLTVVGGNAELLAEDSGNAEDVRRTAAEIGAAVGRAGGLVEHLMAFSRDRFTAPKRVDLGVVLSRLPGALEERLHRAVALDVQGPTPWPRVRGDERDVEQALVALARNACEASPDTVQLVVDTMDAPGAGLDTVGAHEPGGPWVRIRVRDGGEGMSAETLEHAFEPFFTTRDRTAHPGLGLTAAYGIVAQA